MPQPILRQTICRSTLNFFNFKKSASSIGGRTGYSDWTEQIVLRSVPVVDFPLDFGVGQLYRPCGTRFVLDKRLSLSHFARNVASPFGHGGALMMCNVRYFLAFVCMLGLVLPALPQSRNTGEIRGTVTAGGAVVPGVTVTLTNIDTGESKDFVTNGDGIYDTVSPPAGNYNISFTAPGFKKL